MGEHWPFHASRNASARGERAWRQGELTGVEALGDGGGVAEDAAAEPASDARRDARAAHRRLVVGVHALSTARRELLGMHGGGAGAQSYRHRRRRRGLRGLCVPLVRPCED